MRKTLALIAVVASLAAVAGCGGASPKRTADGRISVIAGENFWGNLAQQIGGSHVAVTSLITSPDADPHLFEPGTQNGLAVATAAVVIVNGANYDPFMDRLLKAAPSSKRRVVRVSSVLHVTGSDPNPTPLVRRAAVADGGEGDRAVAGGCGSGERSELSLGRCLDDRVAQAIARRRRPAARRGRGSAGCLHGAGAGLPARAAAHLKVLTPPGFARSIENGSDPSAADDLAMRQLITQHRIKALLYNEQATSPLTAELQKLATTNHVPVVPVTETMPTGLTFEAWQLAQVRALSAALAG